MPFALSACNAPGWFAAAWGTSFKSFDDDIMAWSRTYMGETVVTVLNKGAEARTVELTLPCGLTCDGKNAFSVTVAPISYAIIQ